MWKRQKNLAVFALALATGLQGCKDGEERDVAVDTSTAEAKSEIGADAGVAAPERIPIEGDLVCSPAPCDTAEWGPWCEGLAWTHPLPGSGESLFGASADDLWVASSRMGLAHYDGQGWTGVAPGDLPPNPGIRAMHGTAADDIFAVGENGSILHYDGQRWSALASGPGARLFDVFAVAADDVYAVGEYTTMLHYDGQQWKPLPDAATIYGDLYGVAALASGDVFVVGYHGISHYDGQRWTTLETGSDTSLFDVAALSATDVYAVGAGAEPLLHYDGETWTAIDAGYYTVLNQVVAVSANDVYALGNCGKLAHYDGERWSVVPTGADQLLYALIAPAPGAVVAAGAKGVFRHDGANWQPMPRSAEPQLNAIAAFRDPEAGAPSELFALSGDPEAGVPSELFAVGDRGTILHNADFYNGSGVSYFSCLASPWTAQASGVEENLLGVHGFGARDLFAVGETGTILHYDGQAWTPMTSGTDATLNAVFAVGMREAFAVGEAGTILRYDGASWKPMDSGISIALNGIAGASADDLYAVGEGGAILHYDGSSWKPMSSPTALDLLAVDYQPSAFAVEPAGLIAVGRGGAIVRYQDDEWTAMESGTDRDLFDVSGLSAVGDQGTMLFYDGAAWQPAAAPIGLGALRGTAFSRVAGHAVGDDGMILMQAFDPCLGMFCGF